MQNLSLYIVTLVIIVIYYIIFYYFKLSIFYIYIYICKIHRISRKYNIMSLYQFNRDSRCGVDSCTSTQYYIDSGLTYCINGHLAQGIIEIDNTNDLNRSQPSRRRKVISESNKNKKKSKSIIISI